MCYVLISTCYMLIFMLFFSPPLLPPTIKRQRTKFRSRKENLKKKKAAVKVNRSLKNVLFYSFTARCLFYFEPIYEARLLR